MALFVLPLPLDSWGSPWSRMPGKKRMMGEELASPALSPKPFTTSGWAPAFLKWGGVLPLLPTAAPGQGELTPVLGAHPAQPHLHP